MVVDLTVIGLYDRFLETNSLIETVVGVYEVSHIIKYGRDSNDNQYRLIADCETRMLLEFLCFAWTSKIRATAFKSAIEHWIDSQKIPYQIIPKKDFTDYVRKNDFLQCPNGFDI